MIFTLAATKNVEKLVKSGDLKVREYVRSQVLNNTHSFTDKFNDLNNYNKTKMSLYSLKIKDTEFKVAVISDPARMKEGLANKPALVKACCLISRKSRKLL
jgi:hypothetical protein